MIPNEKPAKKFVVFAWFKPTYPAQVNLFVIFQESFLVAI